MKQNYSIELLEDEKNVLLKYLKENKIYAEVSGCYNMYHVNMTLDTEEYNKVSKFIENM